MKYKNMPEMKPAKKIITRLSKNGCCPKCNHALNPIYKFCPFCGLSTETEHVCPVCGEAIKKHGLSNHIRLSQDAKHQSYWKRHNKL